MKHLITLSIFFALLFSSCYEDAPCRNFRFEVKGEGAIDSVYYSLRGGNDADDDLFGAQGPSEVPISISQQFCGSDINYFIDVFTGDSSANFQLQVFVDDSMRSETNTIIRKYYEGSNYRYALEAVGTVSQ